jgi:hypothetical protein
MTIEIVGTNCDAYLPTFKCLHIYVDAKKMLNQLEFLATDSEARVRFPALPKNSSWSGTGSTQPL